MSELREKVNKSIERLKAFCPEEGYYLAFSGGKDSVVCKALLEMSGCKYDSFYRVTSVDPPELVRFVKEKHPDVKREVPRYPETYRNPKLAGNPITMWNLIPEKYIPPIRTNRYCCDKLKESGGVGRMTVTGVRWAESESRQKNQGQVVIIGKKKVPDENKNNFIVNEANKGSLVLVNDNDESRRLVEQCFKKHRTTVNPIIDWTDADVWDFIHTHTIPYCSLYDEGHKRLGCIGCPMAAHRQREREFQRWPKYKGSYLRAFEKMIELRKKRNSLDPSRPIWRQGGTEYIAPTAMDVFNWWMEYDVLPGQVNLFEDYEDDDE